MFTLERIVPLSGQLLGVVTSRSSGERGSRSTKQRELSLTHKLVVQVGLLSPEGESWNTELRLDSIDFKVRSWRELSARSYTFLTEPSRYFYADGESIPEYDLYASIRLFEAYNRVEISRIDFGTISGWKIPAELDMEIDLSDEESAISCDTAVMTLKVDLDIGEVAVIGDAWRHEYPGIEEAKALATRFLNLADYKEPIVDGMVKYRPRCG